MSDQGLSLYQFDTCPFCQRVRMVIDELGIDVEIRDTLVDPRHAKDVREATGRSTVPVLRIEEEGREVRWMPESADIIRYLLERYGG